MMLNPELIITIISSNTHSNKQYFNFTNMDRINLLTMEDVLKVNQLETLEKRIDLVWKLRDFVCERETEEELHDFDKWSVNKLSPIITICH